MKKILSLSFLCLVLAATTASADDYVYKSKNKLDYVKIAGAKGGEKDGGLNHPANLSADQVRNVLSSLNFNKKIIMLKDVENRQLFDGGNVEFLTPLLVEAFQKVGPDQVVVVSYFTRDSKLVIQNDRLTIFRAYVKNDGLHLKFSKMYAKLLGDRGGTLGADQAARDARSIRVSLELQPGQNRISWDPEEIVVDVAQVSGAVTAPVVEKEAPVKPAKKEIVRKAKTEKPVAETPVVSTGSSSAAERLRNLDTLRKERLITEKEYQLKKQEVLKQL